MDRVTIVMDLWNHGKMYTHILCELLLRRSTQVHHMHPATRYTLARQPFDGAEGSRTSGDFQVVGSERYIERLFRLLWKPCERHHFHRWSTSLPPAQMEAAVHLTRYWQTAFYVHQIKHEVLYRSCSRRSAVSVIILSQSNLNTAWGATLTTGVALAI